MADETGETATDRCASNTKPSTYEPGRSEETGTRGRETDGCLTTRDLYNTYLSDRERGAGEVHVRPPAVLHPYTFSCSLLEGKL